MRQKSAFTTMYVTAYESKIKLNLKDYSQVGSQKTGQDYGCRFRLSCLTYGRSIGIRTIFPHSVHEPS